MKSDEAAAFRPTEILDALGQAVVVSDLDGRIVYWNDAAEELFGWTADEAVGQNANQLLASPSSREVGEEIMETLRAGQPWSGGFPLCRKDGTQFPALVTDSGIYRDGQLVGLVGITTNVGSAIRPLLERSTDAAIVLRSDAVVAYASPAVNQLFGWEDSIVGTSVVDLLHPDERPALAAFMEQVVRNPGAHPALDLRVLTEQGWVWCEAALTNLLDDPVVRGLVCNLRLNTHRQAFESAERQVEQLNTALRSRVLIEQAKGFLAAKHDLQPDQAFEYLRRYSRSHHVSIHEVARRVVARELDLEVR